MKRNIIIAIILILLLGAISGILYLNNVYLPVKVKAYLTKTLEAKLNFNVRIGTIKYNLIRGIVIEDLAIFYKTEDKENTLLSIKELSSNILFLPLIKERKIIIPIIHVDSPSLYIRYNKDGTFNFRKILESKAQEPQKEKTKLSFFIYKLNIFNAKLRFDDEHPEPKFSKTLQDLNLGANISFPTNISFILHARMPAGKDLFTKLVIEGTYNLLSKEVAAKLNLANVVLTEYKPYLDKLPFSILSGNIENTDFEVRFKDNTLSLKGPADLKTLELKKEDYLFKGDLTLEPQLNYGIDNKEFDYQADFKFLQDSLSGIPYVDKVENLSGTMTFKKNKISAENLSLKTLSSDFTLSGALEDFSLPYLKAKLTALELDLEKLSSLLVGKIQNLKLSGKSKFNLDIDGYLKDLPANSSANFEITNAGFESTFLKEPFTNIRGKVELNLKSATWQSLFFDYQGTTYLTNGKIDDFTKPQMVFALKSKDLDLVSDIATKGNITKINQFSGKFKDSEFDINGQVFTEEKINPGFNLNLKLNWEAANIPDILTLLPISLAVENIKKANPQGKLNIRGILAGNIKDYKALRSSLKITSDLLSLYKLKVGDLYFIIEQKDGLLNIPRLSAAPYSGVVNASVVCNLKPEVPDYSIKLDASGIDLEKLKADTPLKDKDLAGLMNLDVELGGNFKEANSVKGRLYLSVSNGKLWQLNLLKGLGELFFLSDYQKVVFNKGEGNFAIENGFISTEDLTLSGDQLTLQGKGRLAFNGNINLNVYTQANKELIKESADLRKFITAILGEITSAFSVNIGGTIKEPKYNIVPMPVDLIKNIKDFLLGK